MNNWILFEIVSFKDATCDTTLGSTTVTCNTSSNIEVGQRVSGKGIPTNTYVNTVNSAGSVTSFTLQKKNKEAQLATLSNTNVTLSFNYNRPTFLYAYPLRNLNAVFATSDSSIDIYFRNTTQPNESVSDDKITISVLEKAAGVLLIKLIDLFDKKSLEGKKIYIKNATFAEVKNITYTAGA